MYPRNAATPPRIALGAVVQISDGAVQGSGVSVVVRAEGGAETAGGGTISYGASSSIVYYAPTQAETNYTAFVVVAYKTGCLPVAQTIITSASATAGNAGLDWGKVINPTTTLGLSGTTVGTLTTYTGNTPQTGDNYARLGAPAGASVSADVAAVKAETASILTDTAEIGAAGAGLTGITGVTLAASQPGVTIPTVTTLTGHTPQTGDAFARLGAPAGASVSADNAAIKADAAAVKVKTDFLPSATAGAAGGVFIAGTNAATTVTTSFTTTFTGNLTGSVGSVTGAVGSVTGLTASDVSAIKTKTDFLPSVVAGGSGGVLISGTNTGTTTLGALTVTGVTTHTGATTYTGAVTASNASNNFRVNGAVPGASGGLLISGSNAGTTTLGALTVTGATTFTGAVTGSNASNNFRINGVVPGAAGGVFIAGTNAATSITTALTSNIIGDVTGNVSGSVGSVTANVNADVQKVNNVTVNGDGAGTPWGP